MSRAALFVTTLLALAACDSGVESRKEAVPPPEATPAPVNPSLKPTGPAVALKSETGDAVQQAASVIQLTPLRSGNAKLFGTGGGDPAMNGLYTYIAFFQSPAEGWAVYRIGDFLDYRLLGETPGRVDLEITESLFDPGGAAITSRKRRLIVAFTAGPGGAAPSSVTVTPAE